MHGGPPIGPTPSDHYSWVLFFNYFLFISMQGSIKKKIEKLRRWSTSSGGSFKRPPKTKSLSLRQPTETEEDPLENERERRKLRPMVASVFGQVGDHVLEMRKYWD